MGAYWSVHARDGASFERYMSQLIPFYFSNSTLSQSTRMCPLLGLYLLHLLVTNRLANFHSLLEKISIHPSIDPSGDNPFLQFPVQLLQCLVEGMFHRVVLARKQVPAAEYAWFVDGLMETIRNELADCLEVTFEEVNIASAARLLLLGQEQIPQLITFAQQRGWIVDEKNNSIRFKTKALMREESFCFGIIRQSLEYAQQLEQIV